PACFTGSSATTRRSYTQLPDLHQYRLERAELAAGLSARRRADHPRCLHVDEPPAGDDLDAVDLDAGCAADDPGRPLDAGDDPMDHVRSDVLPELPDAADASVLRATDRAVSRRTCRFASG